MPIIPFNEYLPDLPSLGNPGVITAKNAFPSATGFAPVPSWAAITNALTARPRGAIRAKDYSGTAHSYAGDATKIYELSASAWADVTNTGGAYTTGATERWEFVKWANKVLAVNYTDNPQQMTMGGANFTDLTTAVKARHIAVVGDFVVLGNTFDGTDGAVSDRLRWSGFGDETTYTVSASTQSDFTDLRTGGAIQRIAGGEFGVIFQETSIRRMQYVGSPTVFELPEVLPGIGLLASGGIVRRGRQVFFLSQRGFVALTDGTSAEYIGANKVDETVLADIDTGNLNRVSATDDPLSGRVFFSYPGAGNTAGRPNKIAIFDTTTNRWSMVEMEHELLWQGGGVAIDIDTDDPAVTDDATLDLVDISLDSDRYKGSGQNVQAFDDTFKTGAFDGDVNMNAELETGDNEFFEGHHTRLKSFRPIIEGGTVTARIGKRDLLGETPSFGSTLSLKNGRFTKRSNAVYHRFRLNMTGDWSNATGIQIVKGDAVQGGARP